MTEQDEMRALAAAHGCEYEYIPVREKDGIYKRVYKPVRPVPCLRDEHGEMKEQTLKQFVAKIDEELNELKQAIIRYQSFDLPCVVLCKNSTIGKEIAEEAADTITAITTLCHALGIDADMRDEAQRRVNRKNLERGRL